MTNQVVPFLALLSLAACAGPQPPTIEQLAAKCDTYGFHRGTDGHAQCIQNAEIQYETAQRNQNAAIATGLADAAQSFNQTMQTMQQRPAAPTFQPMPWSPPIPTFQPMPYSPPPQYHGRY